MYVGEINETELWIECRVRFKCDNTTLSHCREEQYCQQNSMFSIKWKGFNGWVQHTQATIKCHIKIHAATSYYSGILACLNLSVQNTNTTPIHLCCTSAAPLHLCNSAPMHLCTNAPMIFISAPQHLSTHASLHLSTSAALHQCTNAW